MQYGTLTIKVCNKISQTKDIVHGVTMTTIFVSKNVISQNWHYNRTFMYNFYQTISLQTYLYSHVFIHNCHFSFVKTKILFNTVPDLNIKLMNMTFRVNHFWYKIQKYTLLPANQINFFKSILFALILEYLYILHLRSNILSLQTFI